MQRIEFSLFKSFFEKDLTGNEIDFIITLSQYQNDRGEVCAMHYKEMMEQTGMVAQSFYNCKQSLQEKGVIRVTRGENDYDITLIGNDFSGYTDEDYSTGNVRYISTNKKLFSDANWKKLKPKQKLLAMDLLNICTAGNRTYRIGREKFIEKYADGMNPDGSRREGLLHVTERTLQKYLKMLKLYFYIGLKDGTYYITLRSHFAKRNTECEKDATYRRLIKASCRRDRIQEQPEKEVGGILKLLNAYNEKLIRQFVYIPDLFHRMLEVINIKVADTRKWKRYLKKTLFHKLLNEAVAA